MEAVYRLEGKDGRGAYNTDTYPNSNRYYGVNLSYSHSWQYNRPPVAGDVPDWEYGMLSATEDIPSLVAWFEHEIDDLIKFRNIQLVKYTVKAYKKSISGWQVAFDPKEVIGKEVMPKKILRKFLT